LLGAGRNGRRHRVDGQDTLKERMERSFYRLPSSLEVPRHADHSLDPEVCRSPSRDVSELVTSNYPAVVGHRLPRYAGVGM